MANKLNLYENALVTIKNSLTKSLSFDEKNFLQLFKDNLKDNLSESGKIIYASADFKQSLKNTYKKFSDELSTEYLNLLDLAEKDALNTFDPHATVQKAQAFLQKKLNELNTSLYNNLNDELIAKGQNFEEEDKEELRTALKNYTDNCEKKLNKLVQEMDGIWSKVAKFQLHIRNEAAALKASKPDATFSIKETDLDKLSIGDAPAPVSGFKVNIDNLSEQITYSLANKKSGEKINIEVTLPDRDAILRQIGDIGFQYRSPAVALVGMLIFYLAAMIFNNDEKRIATSIKKVIEEKSIINPQDITLTIKRLDNNGKPIVIKEKVALNPEQIEKLQLSVEEIKKNLQENHSQIQTNTKPGLNPTSPESGYNTENEEEEETKKTYQRSRGP